MIDETQQPAHEQTDPQDGIGEEKLPPHEDGSAETAQGLGVVATEGTQIPVTSDDEELPRHEFVGDPKSRDPKENEALAWDEAHEEKPHRDILHQIVENLKAQGREAKTGGYDNEAVSVIEEVEKQPEHEASLEAAGYLANFEESQKRQEREVRAYKEIRDRALWTIAYVANGTVERSGDDPYPVFFVNGENYHRGYPPVADNLPFSASYEGKNISLEHIYQVREMIYDAVGAKPPSPEEFKLERTPRKRLEQVFGLRKHKFIETVSKQMSSAGNIGLTVIERRIAWLRPEGITAGIEDMDTDSAEVKEFGLWVVPTDQVDQQESQAA